MKLSDPSLAAIRPDMRDVDVSPGCLHPAKPRVKISALLEAITSDLKKAEALRGVRDIKVSPGRFNADEITRHSFRAPALRVAFLGAPRARATACDTRRYEAAFAIFVVTDGKARAMIGVDLTQAVAEAIEARRFGDGSGVGLPENLRLDALYSGDIDDKGIALHSVSWTQALTLGEASGLAQPDDPSAIIKRRVKLTEEIDITTDITTDITHAPEGS